MTRDPGAVTPPPSGSDARPRDAADGDRAGVGRAVPPDPEGGASGPAGAGDREPPTLLLVAGESSGDLHGASLARELARQAPGVRMFGIGGDRMAAAGVDLLYHMRHLAVVGITEVLAHLWDIRRAMLSLVEATRDRDVDGVVLLDYPDFNLNFARRLRRARPSLPIVYYISPQVWAWRRGRVRTIARLVDRMLVILPFEAELYEETGIEVEFVGHPLLDVLPRGGSRSEFAARHRVPEEAEWVGLVPGSRRAEVERLLPPMLDAAGRLLADAQRRFLVPVSEGVDDDVYGRALAAVPERLAEAVHLIAEDYYETLLHSRAAAVCSGTATLEAGLMGTPEVVVYRTSWLTYNLAKLLVRIRDIALVNVVAGHRGVPELLQHDVTGARIARELEPLLEDEAVRRRTLDFLDRVRRRLGEPGASARAARGVLEVALAPGESSRGAAERSPSE